MIIGETTPPSAETSASSGDPQSPENPTKSPAEAVVEIFNTLQPYDEATRQKILASAMALLGITPLSAPTNSGSILPSIPTPSSKRPLSPAELVLAKDPATNSQRIIVFAYYREKHENQNYFSRDDLKTYFSKAKLTVPANYERDFRDAVKQGWLYENGNESYLTGKGLEAVEAGFGGKAAPRGRYGKAKSSRSQKKQPQQVDE